MAIVTDGSCTVYISSCDRYSDLWRPFFILFEKYWPNRPYPVVLGAESKPLDELFVKPVDDKLKALLQNVRCPRNCDPRASIPWGLLTMNMLDNIDTEYVIFMLDDFFISRPVDQAMLTQCLDWMDADPAIGCFVVKPFPIADTMESPYPPFRMAVDGAEQRVTTHAAVWRKGVLRRSIRPLDNPWKWEAEAAWRIPLQRDQIYYLDWDYTDHAAIDYPPVGALSKGYLTAAGRQVLADNGIENTLAAFRM
ncbi:MAG: hypothetical protein LBB86_00100 [Oscillospiraceae bacterium]|nr:hypothetical protein [Oscillospiraceae bacterium]